MPRVNLPITALAEIGTLQPSATGGDATNDHYIDGGSNVIVECKNTSGGVLVVTFQTVFTTSGGIPLADNDISVAAGAIKYVKLTTNSIRLFYQQPTDSSRIHVDVTSNSWEFRVYGI